MDKRERDNMPVTQTEISSKKQRVFAKAKEKFEDKRKVANFLRAGGSLNTSHKFDVNEISKEMRGK